MASAALSRARKEAEKLANRARNQSGQLRTLKTQVEELQLERRAEQGMGTVMGAFGGLAAGAARAPLGEMEVGGFTVPRSVLGAAVGRVAVEVGTDPDSYGSRAAKSTLDGAIAYGAGLLGEQAWSKWA